RSLQPGVFAASADRHADRAQDRRAPVSRHGRGDRAARRARARPAEGLTAPPAGSRLQLASPPLPGGSEPVETLYRDGHQGLAGRAVEVPEYRVGRLVLAQLGARLEAVGSQIGARGGQFPVLRAGDAEVEPVLVVELLDTRHPAQLRREHVAAVTGQTGVLRAGRGAAADRDVLADVEQLGANAQGAIDV